MVKGTFALAEDPVLVTSTFMVAHNYPLTTIPVNLM